MNRLGMIVDISHVSDKTFYDVLEVDEGAGHRLALVVPRARQRSAQHDRRHAPRAGEERRRGHGELLPAFLSDEVAKASKARDEKLKPEIAALKAKDPDEGAEYRGGRAQTDGRPIRCRRCRGR